MSVSVFSPTGRDNLKVEGFIKNITDEHESVYSLITGNDHFALVQHAAYGWSETASFLLIN